MVWYRYQTLGGSAGTRCWYSPHADGYHLVRNLQQCDNYHCDKKEYYCLMPNSVGLFVVQEGRYSELST